MTEKLTAGLIIGLLIIMLTGCIPMRELESHDVLRVDFIDSKTIELFTPTDVLRINREDIDYNYVKTDTKSENYLLLENLRVTAVQIVGHEKYTLYVPDQRYDELTADYTDAYGYEPIYRNIKRNED